jgi:hypothetical protein
MGHCGHSTSRRWGGEYKRGRQVQEIRWSCQVGGRMRSRGFVIDELTRNHCPTDQLGRAPRQCQDIFSLWCYLGHMPNTCRPTKDRHLRDRPMVLIGNVYPPVSVQMHDAWTGDDRSSSFALATNAAAVHAPSMVAPCARHVSRKVLFGCDGKVHSVNNSGSTKSRVGGDFLHGFGWEEHHSIHSRL